MSWLLNPLSGLALRRLHAGDVDPVVALVGRSFRSRSIADQVREELSFYCRSGADHVPIQQQKDTFLWVSYYILLRIANKTETLLGLTGLYRPVWAGTGVFWLGWFGVDSDVQGQGYGIALLHATMVLARAEGGRLLCVESSRELASAIHLYHRMGFRQCGDVPDYWSPGENLLILARSLEDIDIPSGVAWNEI
jgi:GNAT superfamily N-acetyltransferase